VTNYSNPTPPSTSPAAIDHDQSYFYIYTLLGTIITWPFLMGLLLVFFPRLFGLPSQAFDSSWSTAARERWQIQHQGQKARNRNRCCGAYCGLTILYWGIVAVAIWGVIHLANVELDNSFNTYSHDDWAGKYVLLQKTFNGSSASIYSSTGVLLGEVVFTQGFQSWTMALNDTEGPVDLKEIVYNENSNDTDALQFTGSCRPGVNSSNTCFSGNLLPIDIAVQDSGSKYNRGEYVQSLNITLSSNRTETFNTSSQTANISTTRLLYQGIGLSLPPLGEWYLNSATILHVLWSTGSNRACDGLRINLSSDYEVVSWSLFGIIWEWWKSWGESGGCSWD
jgi:hypothetical protein